MATTCAASGRCRFLLRAGRPRLRRQAAREACLAAFGPGADAPGRGGEGEAVASRGCRYLAGPVQVNFQLDEPLTPDLSVEGLFEAGRGPFAQETSEAFALACPRLAVRQRLDAQAVRQLYAHMRGPPHVGAGGGRHLRDRRGSARDRGMGTALQRAAFGRPAFGIAELRRRPGHRQLRQRVRRRGVPLARRGCPLREVSRLQALHAAAGRRRR